MCAANFLLAVKGLRATIGKGRPGRTGPGGDIFREVSPVNTFRGAATVPEGWCPDARGQQSAVGGAGALSPERGCGRPWVRARRYWGTTAVQTTKRFGSTGICQTVIVRPPTLAVQAV